MIRWLADNLQMSMRRLQPTHAGFYSPFSKYGPSLRNMTSRVCLALSILATTIARFEQLQHV